MTSVECGGQQSVEKGVSRKVHFASVVGTVHGQNAIKIGFGTLRACALSDFRGALRGTWRYFFLFDIFFLCSKIFVQKTHCQGKFANVVFCVPNREREICENVKRVSPVARLGALSGNGLVAKARVNCARAHT